ncbi:hypothetical protein CCR85_05000 [Rhodothalassium salexigens]|uniref:MOSC domain-containing protein n=1 Tax=Rhodothalassium salexigens TaxID=1086 RepID=UPI0019116056|nr:MOSC domain-containing protein [Rhodothalassium salexigens]MBK5910850.1 hypothetical protein [Rhodothalassium salexigens]
MTAPTDRPNLPPPARLEALLVGEPKPFGPKGEPSAMDRQPVAGRLALGPLGLAGDRVADTRNHGGADKAVHHYPFDHYAVWATENPALAPRLARPGAFGENLAARGWVESDICIGDVIAWGTAQLQVSQTRQPCWKLNVRFDTRTMARDVERTGRTGWYYRVLGPGHAGADDPLVLVDRPHPDWPLVHAHAVLTGTPDRAALAALAALPALAAAHRDRARQRLARAARG